MIKNTAGKGEIARHKQFFLFSQCFQKTCTADVFKRLVLQTLKNQGLFGKGLKKKFKNARTHACTWLSLYKSIINRIIKEIRIHKFNLPKF